MTAWLGPAPTVWVVVCQEDYGDRLVAVCQSFSSARQAAWLDLDDEHEDRVLNWYQQDHHTPKRWVTRHLYGVRYLATEMSVRP